MNVVTSIAVEQSLVKVIIVGPEGEDDRTGRGDGGPAGATLATSIALSEGAGRCGGNVERALFVIALSVAVDNGAQEKVGEHLARTGRVPNRLKLDSGVVGHGILKQNVIATRVLHR